MPATPADIECPFNKGAERKCIWCEGITNGGTIRMDFKDREDRMKHQHAFCQDKYKRCEIHQAIMSAKYSDDQ